MIGGPSSTMKPPDAHRDTTQADEAAVCAFPQRMIEAWNRGSSAGFAAAFTGDADFVAFEGTHLQGRERIAAFHQQLFDTAVKGTRLVDGRVVFVRFPAPGLAVMHATVGVVMPGEEVASPSRDSMQLFVAVKRDGEWRLRALLNARRLTLERQAFLDDFDALPDEGRREVTDLVARLREREQAGTKAG